MKEEKTKHFDCSLAAVVIIALLFFWFGLEFGRKTEKPKNPERTDTVVVTRVDTFFFDRPTEIVRYVVRHDTLKKVEFVSITDSALLRKFDSLNLEITIPISQAIYLDTTNTAKYEAFVSGYDAMLDSIRIECLQTETTIRIKEPPRRFGVGVQLGVGFSAQGVAAPYLGVGVHYRIW